jgi:hypothetical protein
MAIQSSYASVAEQVIIFNNNVVDLLSKINTLVTTSDPSVTVNITDTSGIIRQFSLPSFGFLKSEIDRLNNNVNSIYSINEAGALIQPTNGTKFRKIITVDLNREPNDLGNLGIVTNFKTKKNWFFDSLLNPQLFIEIDLTDRVENNVRKVLCRRYIPEFAKDIAGNFTPLGQSALNSFNNLFRGKNDFSLDDYLQWHVSTPGVLSPNNPNYDEQMFDLEPNRLELDGLFTVIRIEEDTINRKLFYHIDSLNYIRNILNNGEMIRQTSQLSVGDELIINVPITSTRYRIIEISTTASNPRIRVERIEGNEPIPVGVQTLKIYSPVIYSKNVLISVGYNERNALFVKALNMDNYILSKNWSAGIGYWTNDLRDIDSGLSMDQFYTDNVLDYGKVLTDLVSKRIPDVLSVSPEVVNLVADNFKVVQINRHLTDIPDSNNLKIKHNQQKNLKSEIQQISDTIIQKNKQLKIQRFTSDAERKQFSNELNSLNKQKESKNRLLTSVTNEILSLSNTIDTKVEPIFRIRGFWSIPQPAITKGTKPQEIVQFRVQYKYLSSDGRESPIETTVLADAVEGENTASISNWNEYKTDIRKRVLDSSTGIYSWETEDLSNPDVPNINQLDIPIRSGEQVVVRIKSISEVGWPESPIESDWSNELTIDFPDSLTAVFNESSLIIAEATKEDLRITVENDLTAKGLDDHLSEQITINDITYYHSANKILSGFRDDNGVAIDLYQYILRLETRIKSLEEQVRKVKGELEVIIFKNNELFTVKNGSELTFTIECEDYLDPYTSSGVPTGRVYQNNIYVIKDFLMKIRNKSVDSPLGLLSNRTYQNSNSDYYNSGVPQVFWINQQNELIVDNSSGKGTRTQKDNQFIWMANFDSISILNKSFTKLSENIGNNFTSEQGIPSSPFPQNVNRNLTNSITNVLGSDEYNIGYSERTILNFIGNNNSLLDPSKWIDIKPTVASTTKLLSTIHPQIQNIDNLVETNTNKVKTINGGESNDIDIPINIYFKMNAMDSTKRGLNFEYINLNSAKDTVRHIKKLKFFMENEEENRPFIFTIKFILNRSRVVTARNSNTSSTQLTR